MATAGLFSSNKKNVFTMATARLQDFQRALGAKQPLYDNIVRSGRGLRDKSNPTDTKTINGMLTDLKDKWDLVCSKSVDR